MRNILFVCTGNTCRSPLCEAIGAHFLPHFFFSSRALSGSCGEKASENSVIVARAHGLDISAHLSTHITAEDIEKADEIICMTESHKAILELILNKLSLSRPIHILGEGIPDPFLGSLEIYENCYNLIKSAVISHFFGVKIENILPKDSADLSDLEEKFFYPPWSEKAFLDFLKNKTGIGITLKRDEKIIGYITGNHSFGISEIYNIATIPEERGKGLGRLLLLEFEDRLPLDAKITLEVRKSNSGAVKLYESLGYTAVGLRKGFYQNPKEDAIIMKKERQAL